MTRKCSKNARTHTDICPFDFFHRFRWPTQKILFYWLTNQDIGSSALLVFRTEITSQVLECLVKYVTVYVIMSIHCFSCQVIVVKIRIRIAINVTLFVYIFFKLKFNIFFYAVSIKKKVHILKFLRCKKYTRVWIRNTKTWILCLVHFHFENFEFIWQLLACQCTVVFN